MLCVFPGDFAKLCIAQFCLCKNVVNIFLLWRQRGRGKNHSDTTLCCACSHSILPSPGVIYLPASSQSLVDLGACPTIFHGGRWRLLLWAVKGTLSLWFLTFLFQRAWGKISLVHSQDCGTQQICLCIMTVQDTFFPFPWFDSRCFWLFPRAQGQSSQCWLFCVKRPEWVGEGVWSWICCPHIMEAVASPQWPCLSLEGKERGQQTARLLWGGNTERLQKAVGNSLVQRGCS